MYTKDDKFLVSSCLEKYYKNKKTGINTHTDFLDERRLGIVKRALNHENIPYEVLYFQKECEKGIICFGEVDSSIITCFHLKNSNFRHQDVLGKLFSLGLKESVIGDIFVEEDDIYFLVLSKIKSLIEEEFTELKRQIVCLDIVDSFILKEVHLEYFNISLVSLRLDVVVSKLMNKSRSYVTEYIKNDFVLYNFNPSFKKELLVKEGDVISIRKYGKYRIGKIQGRTKKNSIILEIKKYK